MFEYIKNSIKRKIARRVTKKHPTNVESFNLPDIGEVRFANWENPLVARKVISLDVISFFKKLLKEGDFAIDIGANIGAMSIPISIATGKSGLTIAFDPNPYVFEILEQNSKLNPHLTNILPYNYAISETNDEFYYNSSEASFNNGGISKDKNNRHGKYSLSKKIEGINLQEFLEKNFLDKMQNIKLIKIDTEGYDKEIIKSISDLLIKYKPAVISECFGKNSPEEKFDHFNSLKSKGYSLYYFSDFVADAEFIPIDKKEDMLKWKHFDIYAFHKQSATKQ